MRKVKPTPEMLKLVRENQQLSGFTGYISPETAALEIDMDAVAESAKQCGAQMPHPRRKPRPKF
jgi:hypothetical protein